MTKHKDLKCRMPAKCAFFTQLMRESRKPEDSLAEDGVCCELLSGLAGRQFTPCGGLYKRLSAGGGL